MEPVAERQSRALCAFALGNALSLALAWLFDVELLVHYLSAIALLLCGPLCVDVCRRASANLGSPLFLVLESACTVLVAVHSSAGLRWLTLNNSLAIAAVQAIMPLACLAWLCRLGVESALWSEHVSAVVEKEFQAQRLAAAGTARRLLDGAKPSALAATPLGRLATLAATGSGRLWRRLTAALSLTDWALLARMWAAVDDSSTLVWFLPALLAVDVTRIAVQMLHSAALLSSGNTAHGVGSLAGLLVPAGISSRLSAGVFWLNVSSSAALCLLAMLAALPGFSASWLLITRAVLATRFLRLLVECAYIVASLTATAPHRLSAAADECNLQDACAVLALPLDEHEPTPPSAPPGRGLDAFSSLALAGMRGYLRADEAATALRTLFQEADKDKSGSISVSEIASWLQNEPEDGRGGLSWRASVRRVLASLPMFQAPPPPPPPTPLPAAPAPLAMSPLYPPYRPRGLRLLSLEGGGIKGLTLIWQLQEVERQTGRPIWDLFDLIGGCSTGGIVALALVNRVPLATLEALYLQVADEVFAKGSALRQLVQGHSCDSAPLLSILQAKLGAQTPLRGGAYPWPAAFVVATNQSVLDHRLEVRLLRTYESGSPSKGRDTEERWLAWEAAAATSAAPTILPPFRRRDGATFVDGALSGNANPSLLVCLEGLQFAKGRPIDVMLSLGCGDTSADKGESGSGLLYWLNESINLAFDARLQEERAQRLLAQVSPSTRYVRLSPLMGDCALAEHRRERLESMRRDTQTYLAMRRADFEQLCSRLEDDEDPEMLGGGVDEGQLTAAQLL